jgi:hypothetical protein
MLGSLLELVVLYWSVSQHVVPAPAGRTGPHQAHGSLLALAIIKQEGYKVPSSDLAVYSYNINSGTSTRSTFGERSGSCVYSSVGYTQYCSVHAQSTVPRDYTVRDSALNSHKFYC